MDGQSITAEEEECCGKMTSWRDARGELWSEDLDIWRWGRGQEKDLGSADKEVGNASGNLHL